MDKQAVDTMPVGTMPAELSQFTDKRLAQQVGTASVGDAGAQATSVDPKPAAVIEAPNSLAGRIADVIRREEHDLTRLVDEAKGWSEKEGAMFVELVERRLQSMEQRLTQLEAR